MASEKHDDNDCFFITWFINNFSYCWQRTGESLSCPSFCVNRSEETKWKLLLFPRGRSDDLWITICLCRVTDCFIITDVDYGIQFLASDGSILYDQKHSGNQVSILRSEIEEESRYLPQDTLTLRCRISSEGKTSEIQHLFFRTIIYVESVSSLSSIEEFSNLEADEPQSFLIKSASQDIVLQIDLFVIGNGEKDIFMNIYPFDEDMKYFTLKTFILDSKKSKVNADDYKCWMKNRKCVTSLLKLTKSYLMENKNLYLPNGVLTLAFELTISTGFTCDVLEKEYIEYNLHPTPNRIHENCRNCIGHEKISDCHCALVTDLTSLQKDESTCDMKLQTKTNTFPVHTVILSARSPVFKAMFSSDMKETINRCVDVSDLDDGTVRRFLLYLYTDQLEDLKWEEAFHLYTAADKYSVNSLKDKCSAFLKNNLHPENVFKVLALSDLHQDKDLKATAQNYLLKNASIILRSEEWNHFVDTYSKLAIETISRNWIDD